MSMLDQIDKAEERYYHGLRDQQESMENQRGPLPEAISLWEAKVNQIIAEVHDGATEGNHWKLLANGYVKHDNKAPFPIPKRSSMEKAE